MGKRKSKSSPSSSPKADSARKLKVVESDSTPLLASPALTRQSSMDSLHSALDEAEMPSSETRPLTAYVTSTEGNIAEIAATHVVDFYGELTKMGVKPVEVQFHIKSGAIKIKTASAADVDKIYKIASLSGVTVSVTPPKGNPEKYQAQSGPGHARKCVITGVPFSFTEMDIKFFTHALSAKRILRRDQGNLVPTKTIILTFKEEIPSEVTVAWQLFKTATYVPKPLRCSKCNRFGHHVTRCKSAKTICSFCAGEHAYADCKAKGNLASAKCANCGQNHSAAYHKCPHYQNTQSALQIRADEKISYRDALVKAKQLPTNQANINALNSPETVVKIPENAANAPITTQPATSENIVTIQPIVIPDKSITVEKISDGFKNLLNWVLQSVKYLLLSLPDTTDAQIQQYRQILLAFISSNSQVFSSVPTLS